MPSAWNRPFNKMSEKGAKACNDTAPSMKPGGGGRFKALESKLASEPGVRNPGAVAAAIGRKKYGGAQMAKWSAKGR